VFLISEAPLYHSLQKSSFRVWIGRVSDRQMEYDPADFGLGEDVRPLFQALASLFRALGSAPTRSEFEHILHDLQLHVRTSEHLRLSLYGGAEDISREQLGDPALADPLAAVIRATHTLLAGEHIELGGS